ncbi:hypothetical protein M3A49_29270 [Paraburkholderia sp. CNPSo 3076]|uniref:hypothetical protein n=1 Tax=Paraburkholderia sp. CNPSo 3076 TaxID=2940936 RepID=UPI0022538DCE|nr:hypothetical protein [Paraburkholderia sp. CNPSo 3076]MCX5543530.1 hypothetical protein [Paraburkholderia sp. CNPSo 3076]
MNMEIGAFVIALAVLLVTFLLFGRNLEDSFRAKFLYWLKSTMTMAPLLFAWFSYNEPTAFGGIGALVSIGLAAAFPFGRSYLVAML